MRAAIDRGLMPMSHHDAPVAFPDSMRVLSATVTRRTRSGQVLGPDQRVTPLEALKAMTLWAARQHFEEGTKGWWASWRTSPSSQRIRPPSIR